MSNPIPLFSRYRNVLSGAHRAISISTSKHLLEQKLHPHNGNNAHGAMGTSLYNYGPGHGSARYLRNISFQDRGLRSPRLSPFPLFLPAPSPFPFAVLRPLSFCLPFTDETSAAKFRLEGRVFE